MFYCLVRAASRAEAISWTTAVQLDPTDPACTLARARGDGAVRKRQTTHNIFRYISSIHRSYAETWLCHMTTRQYRLVTRPGPDILRLTTTSQQQLVGKSCLFFRYCCPCSMSDCSSEGSAACLRTGQAAASRQLWRKAVYALKPLAAAGHLEAAQLLSEVLCSAGRPAEAADHLLAAITHNSDTAGQSLTLTCVDAHCTGQNRMLT
jgi:hypothetical protein